MHSPLFKEHPQCEDIVKLLVDCHETHKMGKFWGKCNDIKSELDYCFMQEKIKRRDANLKKAREFDAKFEAYQARVAAEKEKQ
jgi:COX assembly protein 2